MSNSPIGFFDSGVGGLSVYAKFKKLLPNENTIYFGDLKNLPYGNKSQEELIGFARNILDFFEYKKVKAVLIACNTSSALAYNSIKNEYNFKIYPIIQSSARVISNLPNVNRIGVFATVGTVKSGTYKQEILKYNPKLEIKEIACPNWVSIVEKVNSNINPEEDIRMHLEEMLDFNPDKIVLGCTHYPYLIDTLKKFAPQDLFIDPATIFVEYVKNDLINQLNLTNDYGQEEFFVSANPELFVNNSKLFYDIKNKPQIYSS